MSTSVESAVTVEVLMDLYKKHGIITKLNDGKIAGLEKEKTPKSA